MFDIERFMKNPEDGLFVIGEAGVNHNGDVELALKLVDAAVEAGCDAIKFQTWLTDKVYSRTLSIKPDYQMAGTDQAESEYDTIRRLELGHAEFKRIKAYCDEKDILFFSTPDEMDSARFLVGFGVRVMKTASQDVTNLPFLRQVGQLGLPVIYSTGASTLQELVAGAETIRAVNQNLCVLHCVSSYPAPVAEMNLRVIPALRAALGLHVGFSDHTTGIDVACAALALGARVFEKHLTLDRKMPGPDHEASLTPSQMAQYVTALRNVHAALGDGYKRIMPCEVNTRHAFGRYLVAERDMPAGTRLTEDDICFKKVAAGLEPCRLSLIVGARLKHAVSADTPLGFEMLDWA